jgi:hypothetical protein
MVRSMFVKTLIVSVLNAVLNTAIWIVCGFVAHMWITENIARLVTVSVSVYVVVGLLWMVIYRMKYNAFDEHYLDGFDRWIFRIGMVVTLLVLSLLKYVL